MIPVFYDYVWEISYAVINRVMYKFFEIGLEQKPHRLSLFAQP
jgi:hypothetical protein